MYQECLCTFKSFNSLKIHLSRVHIGNQKQQSERIIKIKFRCELDQDDLNAEASETQSQDLRQQLEYNLAALFFKVYQEFNRIVGKNLKQELYGSLDHSIVTVHS